MSFRVTFADGSGEGRDGHEAAGLIQSCHVGAITRTLPQALYSKRDVLSQGLWAASLG